MLRAVECGGMYYIERRFLWVWWQVHDMGIDGTMVPRAFFNKEAALEHCRPCECRVVEAGK